MEYNLENDDLEEEQPRVAGYRTLGIVFFVLAVGGLFIGLLSRLGSLFDTKISVGEWGSVPGILQGTLLGFVWAVFEKLFGGKTGGVTSGTIWEYFELVLAFLLVIAVVVSLVCMIVGLCRRKSASAAARSSSTRQRAFCSTAGRTPCAAFPAIRTGRASATP